MAGRVAGKVAFVTGAARGQGRSHAVRLAEEGADIIAVDIVDDIDSVPYSLATPDELAQTANEVEALDRRIVTACADVRDFAALKQALDDGVAQLGRLDIVVANAGIMNLGLLEDLDESAWKDVIEVNLTGVFHTVKAAIPHLRATGGGSLTLISSVAGLFALPNLGPYVAAKHGVVGLMRTAALELAADNIRVNTIHPTTVDTGMVQNQAMYQIFAPDLDEADRTREVLAPRFAGLNLLPVPWVESRDVSNALLWLASDEARYVTGLEVRIDAGSMLKR